MDAPKISFHSAEWQTIRMTLVEALQREREANDFIKDESKTNLTRGRISILKEMLAWGTQQPPQGR